MNLTGSAGYVSPKLYGKVILLVALAYSIVNTDLLIASVALKSIGENLRISLRLLPWVISASTLPFAGFLIVGGRATDIFGQRKCFLIGMSLFGLGSFLSALAINSDMLFVTRALEGIGSAICIPSSISLINTLLPEGRVRHRAFAILGSMAGIAISIGSLLGGATAVTFGWRFCFFLNLPLIAVALFLGSRVIPKIKPLSTRQLMDIPGAILLCSGIALIIVALSGIGEGGLASAHGLVLFAGGLTVVALFFIHEGRTKDPMIPLSLLRVRNVISVNLVLVFLFAGLIGMFVMGGIFIQIVLGDSATMAGAGIIPYGLAYTLASGVTHFAMDRWPLRTISTAGTGIAFLGFSILSYTAVFAPGFWTCIVLGTFIAGVGIAFAFAALLADGTAAIPARQQGVASALIMTSCQLANAIGAPISLTVFAVFTGPHITSSHSASLAFAMSAGLALLAIIILLVLVKGQSTTLERAAHGVGEESIQNPGGSGGI